MGRYAISKATQSRRQLSDLLGARHVVEKIREKPLGLKFSVWASLRSLSKRVAPHFHLSPRQGGERAAIDRLGSQHNRRDKDARMDRSRKQQKQIEAMVKRSNARSEPVDHT